MKNRGVHLFIVILFLTTQQGHSQKRFYNELGMSVTLGISTSFFESFGFNIYSKNKVQHYMGLFIPISWHDELYGGFVYHLNYKPFRLFRLRLNTDFKVGAGRIAYSSIFMGYIPPIVLYKPFGAILTENIYIPLNAFYLKLGYGIKYTTNFKKSFFSENMAQLCLGYNF